MNTIRDVSPTPCDRSGGQKNCPRVVVASEEEEGGIDRRSEEVCDLRSEDSGGEREYNIGSD